MARLSPRWVLRTIWVLTVLTTISVAYFGLSAWLSAIPIVGSIAGEAIAEKSSDRAKQAARIREQIDGLYTWGNFQLLMAKTVETQGPDDPASFARRIDGHIFSSKRHLASGALLKAYEERGKDGLSDREWAFAIAKTWISDLKQLQEEYRKVSGIAEIGKIGQ